MGNIDTFGTKKEIKYLPEILNPSEIIKGISSGFMDNATWLLVVTTQRILLLDKEMIVGLKQFELPISKIKSISHNCGIFFGEILIDTGAQIKTFKKNAPR